MHPILFIILDILKEINSRKLQYLDLVIPNSKQEISVNGFTWACNFQHKNYKHLWHSADNHQLNTLIDLIINLSENIYKGHQKILKCFPIDKLEFIEDLKIIRENIDYLNTTVSKIKVLSKTDISKIIETVTSQPKLVEIETKNLVEQTIKSYQEKTDKILSENRKDIEKILSAIKDLKEVTLGY